MSIFSLSTRISGNTIEEYGWALGIFLGLWLAFFIVQKIIVARAKRYADSTETEVDNVAVRVVESFRPSVAVLLAGYIALYTLTLGDLLKTIIDSLFIVGITYQVVVTMQVVVDFLVTRATKGKHDAHTRVAMKLLSALIKGAIWVFAVLLILSNSGVNITSLIAGVGIGGIAIAFALQSILKDLFSSFSLYFDKPFTVGDFIVVGEDAGTVKEIGVKTTRIKSLSGEELIIPNAQITEARVQNYREMKRRRVVQKLAIAYNTPTEKIRALAGWVEEIIDPIESMTFSRATFLDFGDSALILECVYFIEVSDYDVYMRAREAFNLGVKEKFDREGVEFAYPTSTIYLKKTEGREEEERKHTM